MKKLNDLLVETTKLRAAIKEIQSKEKELKAAGKNIEFHRYPEAGHGFFYFDRPIYHQSSAVDGWDKMFKFLGKQLG